MGSKLGSHKCDGGIRTLNNPVSLCIVEDVGRLDHGLVLGLWPFATWE